MLACAATIINYRSPVRCVQVRADLNEKTRSIFSFFSSGACSCSPGRGSLLLLGEIKTINLVLACTAVCAGDCFAVQYVLGSLAPAVASVAPMIAVSLQQLHWCRGPLVSRRHDLGTMHGPRRGTMAQCAIQMQRYGDTEYKPDGSDHSSTCPWSSEHRAYYVIMSSFPCPPASPSIPFSHICI